MDEITNGGSAASGSSWRRYGSAAALVAGGLVAGGVLASTLSANAADPSPSPSATASTPSVPGESRDESRSYHPGEKLLTGDTANKVRAAALAKYPGATVERVETDSDGVYEVHLVTSAGERVTVEVGKDFAVTGTEAGGHGGGRHGGMRPEGTIPGSGSPSGSSSGGSGWSDDVWPGDSTDRVA